MTKPEPEFSLHRHGDQLVLRFANGHDEVPVRTVWARPLTGRGEQISVLDVKTKKELLLLRDYKRLDPESQALLGEELGTRYFIPRITRVFRTSTHFGNRYWHIDTDRGERRFLMKSPDTNMHWVTKDHCVLQDVLGNCYEITSLAAMDEASRKEVERVI